MRKLSLTSFASVVLVVLFFEGGQASVVAVEPANQPVNTNAGLSEVVPVNAAQYPASTKPRSNCCVTSINRTDYTVTPGVGVHKFFKQPLTWNAARDMCVRDGAQLAVINSDAEETHLRNWKNNNSVKSVWIGVHNHFERDWWVNMVGEPLAGTGYDIWAPNQPSNDDTEHCGMLSNDQLTGETDRESD